MKYIIAILGVMFLFTGCSQMTPIQKASDSKSHFTGAVYQGENTEGVKDDTNAISYRVFHQGSSGFTSLSVVRASAERRASAFCSARGKAMTVTSIHKSSPPHILGNFPRVELLFVCLDKENNVTLSKDTKYQKLAQLKELLDNGTLTQEEFDNEKKKILKD